MRQDPVRAHPTRALRRVLLAACAAVLMHVGGFAKAAEDTGVAAAPIAAGSELDYPPYAIVKPDGEPDGFSVELLKAVASEMRIGLAFQVGPWNEILRKFRAGQLQVLPLFAMNPERAKYADATIPYLTVYGAVFVRKDERRIRAFGDLPGKLVIVMKGDFGHEYALSHGLGEHLVATASVAEGMNLLASGKHDALLVSRLGGLQVLKQLGIKNIVPVGPPIEDYQLKFSFAVRKGNAELLARLNEGLALIKTNGTYDKIHEKWLGVLDPRPVTFQDFVPYLIPAAGILIALLAGLILQRRLLILRKRTEEQLRKQREWLRVTLTSIGDGVIATDLEGRVTFMNAVAEDLTGWPVSEAIGKRLDDVFRILVQHGRQAAENPVAKVLATGATVGLADQTILVRRDGTEVPIDDSGAPIRDRDGKATGVVLAFRDITERQRAEAKIEQLNHELEQRLVALEAANKELDAFAYSVSHDLRAPLRGVDAFVRILLDKYASPLEEDARHCLQMIRDNSTQMGLLIDDLLGFSRLSQKPLVKETVRQEVLVQDALEGLEAERKGRQIELSVGELPAAEADPHLLKQVWINLIGNALKYTRSRDQAVIRIGSETKNGVPVYFVQDNGVGFDMRYAGKLFGVFQRLHRAEDYEGTGVGLAIVQRIIGRHGGRVWVQAAKNQGATFYFTLEGADEQA
ncbi:MAG: transporter substrate-binding domain-containing protein [Betaproteobacteria bacterium]|nr:transporter substrate-binding domain-containing protein [Betaproteobacteria bacterium]